MFVKFCISFVALCFVFTDISPQKNDKPKPDVQDNITGIWSFSTGVGDDESRGTVLIHRFGDIYLVTWQSWILYEDGYKTSITKGVGMKQDDILSISWSNGKVPGVTVMKFEDKQAEGYWVHGETKYKTKETWERLTSHRRRI